MSYATSRPADRLAVGTYTASNTAGQIYAFPLSCYSITFQAEPNNIVDVYIGGSSAQPIHLQAGQSVDVNTNNINNFYALTSSTSSAVINWIALG